MLSQPLPQRQSLAAQAAAYLNAQIESGEWHDWLPSERALCEILQVSRNTLRSALVQLKRERRIRSVHGSGNQVLAAAAPLHPTLQSRGVALLTPEPIERLRPMQTLWIDEMRGLLGERGVQLRVFHGRQYFHANPGPALQRLIKRNCYGCWILMLANEPVQRWFSKKKVPCIVAGSTHAELDLPFRDLDHRAMCRHAAGTLLALGHRQIALLTLKSGWAGDVASEDGFVEGVTHSSHPDATPIVAYHAATVASVGNLVRRLMRQPRPPTALVVSNPHYYLTVTSKLAELGLRIPQDVSLVSRDDDPFLSFVVPTPACYAIGPHVMAKNLLRPVLDLLDGRPVAQKSLRFMPEFIRGESMGPPPSPRRE